jgi:hypothetical protein
MSSNSPYPTLKESGGRSGTGFRQNKARSLLVVSEIALAVVLLMGAALLIRTFIAFHAVNPGFDARDVLVAKMSLADQRFVKTAGVAKLVRDGLRSLNTIPGVLAAGAAIGNRLSMAVQLHAIETPSFVQQRRQATPLLQQRQGLWELHLALDFDGTNHVTAAAAAVAVEQALSGIHQEAWLVIVVQRAQPHPSTATESPNRSPIVCFQIAQ